jgi:hypothetical protein
MPADVLRPVPHAFTSNNASFIALRKQRVSAKYLKYLMISYIRFVGIYTKVQFNHNLKEQKNLKKYE